MTEHREHPGARPQGRTPRVRRRILAPMVLLLVLLTASATPAVAQEERTGLWPTDYLEGQLSVDEGLVDVPRLGQTPVGFTLRDISGDNQQGQSVRHLYNIRVTVETPGVRGWSAGASPASGLIESGETVQGTVIVRTGAIVDHHTVTLNVTSILYGAEGAVDVSHTLLQARVMPFPSTSLTVEGAPPTVEPDEITTLDLRVTNLDVYPDTFNLDAAFLGPGWSIGVPDQVSLLGGETRVVPINIKAPNERFYYLGDSSAFSVNATSLRDTSGSQLDSVWYSAKVQGLYVPGYMVPVIPLGILLIAILIGRSRRRMERRSHEKGVPRKPQPSPREEVLLSELEERNPDAAKEKQRRLEEEYAARKALYPDHRERQLEPLPVPGQRSQEEPEEEPDEDADAEPHEPQPAAPPEPPGEPDEPSDDADEAEDGDVDARRRELLERKRKLLKRRLEARRRELEGDANADDDAT